MASAQLAGALPDRDGSRRAETHLGGIEGAIGVIDQLLLRLLPDNSGLQLLGVATIDADTSNVERPATQQSGSFEPKVRGRPGKLLETLRNAWHTGHKPHLRHKDTNMTDYIAEITKVTDQYLAAVAKVQDCLIEAIEAFEKNLAELPQSAVDLAAAAEFNAAAFDVAEKALALHRAVADKLITELMPAA